MVQYIDKSTLVAEIRKRFDEYSNSILKHYDTCKEAKAQELGKILTILDTFEVKEVDLEKEVEKYLLTNAAFLIGGDSKLVVHHIAKHFFELGLSVNSPITAADRGIADETWSMSGLERWIAWLEKQGEQKQTLPKWKYKKDHAPLLRDSIILNKYVCVAKSPSGAIVSDVWVIDYDELAKLPKEELEKQCDASHQQRVEDAMQEVEEKAKIFTEAFQGKTSEEILAEMRGEQKPIEWSTEDEKMAERLLGWLDTLANYIHYDAIVSLDLRRERMQQVQKLKTWLKSLRPQKQWKPSEEQMDALEHFVRSIGESGYASPYDNNTKLLYSLLEQLKKLK